MKILILGDSFCDDDGLRSWPGTIRKNINNSKVTCVGVHGCSNYTILTNFRKYYTPDIDCIIISLTAYSRIPFVEDDPHLSSFLPYHPAFESGNLPKGFREAVLGYIKFFYNEDLLWWITQNVIDEIESAISPTQKLIWIDGCTNKNSISDYIKVGKFLNGSLAEVSACIEMVSCGLMYEDYVRYNDNDMRSNHLCYYNQEVLGKHLVKVIENYDNLTSEDLDLTKLDWTRDKNIIWPDLKIPNVR